MVAPNDPRVEYISLMGPQLGLLCYELRQDVDWLQNKWTEFQELFSKGEERITLLNTVASNFFWFLRKMMFEDAMLHLCRLTDPPETRIHTAKKVLIRKNLTAMALPNAICDAAFRDLVKSHTQTCKQNCEFARQVRNRLIAHSDFESAQRAGSGPQIFRSHVEEAIKSLRALVWLVEEHYGYPPSLLLKDPFGASSLIFYLERATRGAGASP